MTTKSRREPKAKAAKSGIIAGLNHGFKTTPRARPVSRKTRLGLPHPRLRAVKSIVQEVTGLTALDKRVTELLRVSKEKRAVKVCKKRLGSFSAAKKRKAKVEEFLRTVATKKK